MKDIKIKKLVLFFIMCLFISCNSIQEKMQLQKEYNTLCTQKHSLESTISELNAEITTLTNERNALINGKEPKYIVKFKIKQGTYTLDIWEHMKNEVNAIEFEIPVCKEFYNYIDIGQDITNSFKYGSLLVNGDFSVLHIRVINKRVE